MTLMPKRTSRKLIIAAAAIFAIAAAVYAVTPKALTDLNAIADNVDLAKVPTNAPRIGVTTNSNTNLSSKISRSYYDAVVRAGGVPVVIPTTTDRELLSAIVDDIDGLLLTGGGDVDPSFFGQKPIPQLGEVTARRDTTELMLVRLADNRHLPMFGVCRGCQLLNVAFNGTLYQDIYTRPAGDLLNHKADANGNYSEHEVTIDTKSKLFEIIGDTTITVNSSHHQAVDRVADSAKAVARANDGIIEAIDFYPQRRIIGVQWHPEQFWGRNPKMNAIYDHFVKEAALYHKAREIHSHILSIDTHTDAPLCLTEGQNIADRMKNCANLPKMREGLLDAQFFAAYVSSAAKVKNSEGKVVRSLLPLGQSTYDKAEKQVQKLIGITRHQTEINASLCGIARNREEALALKRQGKKAIFLGVENGLGIGTDLSRLRHYAEQGVVYVTLCHVYDNQICHSSSHTANARLGLTDFGKKVVAEMNRLGMLIDLSHASEGTFYDVVRLSKTPVICSHSSCRALCDNDRNLTDNQLRALAKNGGVCQVCNYSGFLVKKGKKATLDDYIRHIVHVIEVAGIDHVGIGTDFDGGGGVEGCMGDNDMINITLRLLELGYSESDIEKIWGGNFFRVLEAQRPEHQ